MSNHEQGDGPDALGDVEAGAEQTKAQLGVGESLEEATGGEIGGWNPQYTAEANGTDALGDVEAGAEQTKEQLGVGEPLEEATGGDIGGWNPRYTAVEE